MRGRSGMADRPNGTFTTKIGGPVTVTVPAPENDAAPPIGRNAVILIVPLAVDDATPTICTWTFDPADAPVIEAAPVSATVARSETAPAAEVAAAPDKAMDSTTEAEAAEADAAPEIGIEMGVDTTPTAEAD